MRANFPFTVRLKEARLAKSARLKAMSGRGYSQERLGVAAGIEEASASVRMNQYEQGVHLPNLDLAKRLAAALDVPLAYLFCEDDDMARLLLLIHALPPEQRDQLAQFAATLAEG